LNKLITDRPASNDRKPISVEVRKTKTEDQAFMALAEMSFGEWNIPENEVAFRDL
jgi:hypothetical protein